MKVLIACENSGVVRDAFVKRGHHAFSCDLLPTEKPGLHIQGDVLEIINDPTWDLMIAHPPCTYLSISGMHWTTRGLRDKQLTEDALQFVLHLMNAPIQRICIENPVSIISTRIRKPDQTIQPWQFGHNESKKTCLWLKNLPMLKPTVTVRGQIHCCGNLIDQSNPFFVCPTCGGNNRLKMKHENQTFSGQNKLPPSKDRWKIRSKTYPGIADAFAEQWGIF